MHELRNELKLHRDIRYAAFDILEQVGHKKTATAGPTQMSIFGGFRGALKALLQASCHMQARPMMLKSFKSTDDIMIQLLEQVGRPSEAAASSPSLVQGCRSGSPLTVFHSQVFSSACMHAFSCYRALGVQELLIRSHGHGCGSRICMLEAC